ncbi:taste receptor type 2 member 40-like [Bufo bufo]|uniref:taste receptor type 2 member 40-like n=1 Tax=Bufo bufo TaxID=8384 RepID=UPI001ABE4749|nr:taste receptor type 2 member 40-like [Bufo bufo]
MLPTFLLISMTILGITTVIGSIGNSIIIAVNITDKIKGKVLSPSDQILLMMGLFNVLFQFIMIINDFLSFLDSDFYFSEMVYILFSAIINFPVFTSFWLTACLSISYCFQIVIFTHPFLVRLKFAVFQFIPQLLITSVLISLATCIPVIWNTIMYDQRFNMTSNQTMEAFSPHLTVEYLIISNLISCSLPLVLAGIANGLIIKSLVAHTKKAVRNAKGDLNARTEGQVRAARTISCLLFIYVCFYISELLLFTEMFPPSSPAICVCLVIIYSYSPAQSIVLILGSPKLKQASVSIIHCLQGFNKEVDTSPSVAFIKLNIKRSATFPRQQNRQQNTEENCDGDTKRC